jgi:hypothetical protein
METVSVVCWLWNDSQIRTRHFEPEHVNVLQRMVARHLKRPHRFICVADSPEGLSEGVEFVKAPADAVRVGELRSPEGARFPSCYRRLWMFSDAARCLGSRVLLVDIDLVVVNPLDPLFDHAADFMGWRPFRDWGAQLRFGGGIYLLRTGSRTAVWDDFNGADSIAKARSKGFRGSDQAWISYKLGSTEPYYQRDAGIYSIRDFASPIGPVPADARLVQMNGNTKPWQAVSTLPWVREHWQ